jgi:hypothetical protein
VSASDVEKIFSQRVKYAKSLAMRCIVESITIDTAIKMTPMGNYKMKKHEIGKYFS